VVDPAHAAPPDLTGRRPVTEWRGSAFGLELRGEFAVPGSAGDREPRRPLTTLSLVAAADRAGLARPDMETLFEQPLPRGAFKLGRRSDGGYLFQHDYYGHFLVSSDGGEITCSPDDLPDWLWQRFLVAQPLPLASVLNGYEALHAGAVAINGQAALVMGGSGAGKSSVVLHLLARGASFLADDVAALEIRGDRVVVHPGAALVSVDADEIDRVPVETASRWTRLGELEGEIRLELGEAGCEPLPVGAVYVLVRTGDGLTPVITTPGTAWPTVLLGGTFNAYVRDPERLLRQLEVSGRLADDVPLRKVAIPPAADAGTVAAAIEHDFSP
jgi:hypothetical protein